MIPIGMSRCGFLASCAAVLTASNPIYAKKTIPAPAMIPLVPKCSRSPVLAGMNGCQLAPLMPFQANAMKRSTTATLMITITSLTRADSLMPFTRSAVTSTTISTAGKLKTAVTVLPSAIVTGLPDAAESAAGM